MSKIGIVIGFVVGAVSGAAASYVYTKKRMTQKCEEAIESMKEVYGAKKKQPEDIPEKVQEPEEKKVDVTKILQEYQPTVNKAAEKKSTSKKKPKVITPEEFGDFDIVELRYFEDGETLVDQDDEQVSIAETVGFDALNKFGSNGLPDNMVYVRNFKNEIDYEVTLFHSAFGDEEE